MLASSPFIFRVLSFSGVRNCDNSCRGLPVELVRYAFQWAHVRCFQSLYYTIYGTWYGGAFYPRIFVGGMGCRIIGESDFL